MIFVSASLCGEVKKDIPKLVLKKLGFRGFFTQRSANGITKDDAIRKILVATYLDLSEQMDMDVTEVLNILVEGNEVFDDESKLQNYGPCDTGYVFWGREKTREK